MLTDSFSYWDDLPLGPIWQSVKQELMPMLNKGGDMEEGSWTLQNGCRVIVSSYESKPEAVARFEAHMVMADVQIVLAGQEYLDVHTVNDTLSEAGAYDLERDIVFFHEPVTPMVRVLLRPGIFVLLRPHDAHRPSVAVGTPDSVKKMVVKIPDAWLDLSSQHLVC